LELNFSTSNEVYFLGENGVGKTILLQAIVLGFRESSFNKADIRIPNQQGIQVTSQNREINLFGYGGYYPNLFAYGVSRLRTHAFDIDKTGFGTLFDRQNVNLIHPVNFLKDILLREHEGIGLLKLEQVLRLFTDILNIDESSEIRIEKRETDFLFFERNHRTEFEDLADGYRSILLLLSDLFSRLIANQPTVSHISQFAGAVLIDEIDMLLHPRLEYNIVKRLREKLPNIQWFFSTHSPTLILGASPDAEFYKLYRQNGITKISEAWTFDQIKGLMANGLLTSPLFNLPSAGMKSLVDKTLRDTGPDYFTGLFHQNIAKRLEHRRRAGQVYFREAEIEEFVNAAIDELEKSAE
jgi:hypothetical protein